MIFLRFLKVDSLGMQKLLMLTNHIGNIGIGGFLDESLLILPCFPESSEFRHANHYRFDKLQKVNTNFLSDQICLFDTCVIVVVNAAIGVNQKQGVRNEKRTKTKPIK